MSANLSDVEKMRTTTRTVFLPLAAVGQNHETDRLTEKHLASVVRAGLVGLWSGCQVGRPVPISVASALSTVDGGTGSNTWTFLRPEEGPCPFGTQELVAASYHLFPPKNKLKAHIPTYPNTCGVCVQ